MAETYTMKIVTAYYKNANIVGGLLEVYNDCPWVSRDEEGREYELIDHVSRYWGYGEDGEWKEIWRYGFYDKSFINPSEITSVTNGSIYDIDGTEYYYCEISTRDGGDYWLPDLWQSVAEVLEGETDEDSESEKDSDI